MKAAAGAPAEPFFLKVDGGQRFCLYHPPAGPARGTIRTSPARSSTVSSSAAHSSSPRS